MIERVAQNSTEGSLMKSRTARTTQGQRSAFTLIEVLVAIIVIGALVGLLIVGLTRAGRFARQKAAQQTLSSLKTATLQFKSEMGYLPPLVFDGSEMGGQAGDGASSNAGPVHVDSLSREIITVYQLGNTNARAFLRGDFLGSGSPDYDDPRYSKFSLPFYVVGALDAQVDGVDGPGMSKPLPDGAWAGVGDALGGSNKTYEPFMDTGTSASRIERQYTDPSEVAEHSGSTPGDLNNRLALIDANGKAYRYYRWLPNQNPTNTLELNIPAVLLDPVLYRDALADPTIDVTDGDVKLRSASFAIIGAGQNKVFGTEDIDELRSIMSMPGSIAEAVVRRAAAADNIVEVGE